MGNAAYRSLGILWHFHGMNIRCLINVVNQNSEERGLTKRIAAKRSGIKKFF